VDVMGKYKKLLYQYVKELWATAFAVSFNDVANKRRPITGMPLKKLLPIIKQTVLNLHCKRSLQQCYLIEQL